MTTYTAVRLDTGESLATTASKDDLEGWLKGHEGDYRRGDEFVLMGFDGPGTVVPYEVIAEE